MKIQCTNHLPTTNHLRQLHVRGIIGYGTRCIRRVESYYSSGRFAYAETIRQVLATGEQFASVGRCSPINWRDVRQAALYAADADAEAVALSIQRLTSAIINAQQIGCASSSVYEYTAQAVDVAHDACFSGSQAGADSFVDAAWEDYTKIKNLSLDRYPTLGPLVDISANGPLGSEWPIWEDLGAKLKSRRRTR